MTTVDSSTSHRPSIVSRFFRGLLIFIIAWIGQFYGHNVEGKKPSFLKDLQFLLIGPAWVADNVFRSSR